MYPCVSSVLTRESKHSWLTISWLGARLGNMVNVSELLINTVNRGSEILLMRSNQKVRGRLILLHLGLRRLMTTGR
jgi:hypothetical protein